MKKNLAALSIFVLLFSFGFVKGDSGCSAMQPEMLFGPVDQETHGAPVQSVAWLCGGCDTDTKTYAAIAGFQSEKSGEEDIVLRVYELNDIGTPFLDQKATATGANLYAVDWCCSGTVKYVAVGGVADSEGYEVHVYEFDAAGPSLDLRASFTHGADVYSVAWLCECDQCVTGTPLLAIGGAPSSLGVHPDFRILEFYPSGPNPLTEKSQGFHGATVNSLDWCCRTGKDPLLALGGVPDSCGVNFRIYSVDCEGFYAQLVYGKFPFADLASSGTDVHSVRWCCDVEGKHPLLAVAGEEDTSGNNLAIYRFNTLSKILSRISTAKVPLAVVNSIDWIDLCDCSYLAAGGAMQDGQCANIFVYKKDAKCNLNLKASAYHDDNVNSLEWCKKGTCYYLLVGTDGTIESGDETELEIALFRGVFCTPIPTPICQRSETAAEDQVSEVSEASDKQISETVAVPEEQIPETSEVSKEQVSESAEVSEKQVDEARPINLDKKVGSPRTLARIIQRRNYDKARVANTQVSNRGKRGSVTPRPSKKRSKTKGGWSKRS